MSDGEEDQQHAETEVNGIHQAVDQRLLFGFGDEETFHLEDGHCAEGDVGEDDDAPAVPLAQFAFQADHVAVVQQDDGGDDGGEDVPVTCQFDAFFAGRPDAEDFVEADRHEDADAAGGEVHEKHLPGGTKLERVAHQRADFLPKVGFCRCAPCLP